MALLVRGKELNVYVPSPPRPPLLLPSLPPAPSPLPPPRLELPLVDETAALLPVLGVGRGPHLVDRVADLHAHVARRSAVGVAERDGDPPSPPPLSSPSPFPPPPHVIVVVVVAVRGATSASTRLVGPAAVTGSTEIATSSSAARAARMAGWPSRWASAPKPVAWCTVLLTASSFPSRAGYGRTIRGRPTARYGTGVPAAREPAATARTPPGALGHGRLAPPRDSVARAPAAVRCGGVAGGGPYLVGGG